MQTGFAIPASAGHLVPASQIERLAGLLDASESLLAASARRLHSPLSQANTMAVGLLRSAPEAEPLPARRRACAGLAPWQQRRIRDLVEERMHESLSVVEMAAAVRLSRSFFSRAFSVSFECSPHFYVMRRRIARAKVLMQATSEPLAQIAAACGLSDQAHLSRLFRRHAELTPSDWRRRIRAGYGSTQSRGIVDGNAALAVA
ncbi:AraC family transcriptional regulator [Roseomonas sp. KE2513]|uniref:helix-turn-helix domain-containing protein n=1 Tax=Roseomonas sp. KE2513 TaxID=2479202 RepID=UPI0018E018BC|nr:AraC family transcriptional regulator [Roseomonas sp. KE2513]MBI0538612.1 AraC family transcriptional regulator [Roseomonas sp. KE2513]